MTDMAKYWIYYAEQLAVIIALLRFADIVRRLLGFINLRHDFYSNRITKGHSFRRTLCRFYKIIMPFRLQSCTYRASPHDSVPRPGCLRGVCAYWNP